MKHIHLLTISATLIVALTAPAQQTATGSDGAGKEDHAQPRSQYEVPTVEMQLKVLTEKLGLSGEQQIKIKSILEELRDATQKLVQDESTSREELLNKVRPHRYQADKKIRSLLSDEQKKKLDQYLQGPHGEMHGNLSGAPPRIQQN